MTEEEIVEQVTSKLTGEFYVGQQVFVPPTKNYGPFRNLSGVVIKIEENHVLITVSQSASDLLGLSQTPLRMHKNWFLP